MVEFISILLIAHLLGDFVFQTNKIAMMKSKSVKGISFHVTIVGVTAIFIMSFFYGLWGGITAIIITIIHFCIDYMKLKLKNKIKKVQTLYFLFDQGLHILVLLVASSFWKNPVARYQIKAEYSLLIIMSIIGYYVLSILVKYVIFDLKWMSQYPFFLKNERPIDGVTALILLYLNLLLTNYGFLTFVLYILYRFIQKKNFKYEEKICLLKFVSLYLFAIVQVLF